MGFEKRVSSKTGEIIDGEERRKREGINIYSKKRIISKTVVVSFRARYILMRFFSLR